MTGGDIIALTAAALIIGAACFYIIRAKRHGKKCIGCPYAESCQKHKCSGETKDGCSCNK